MHLHFNFSLLGNFVRSHSKFCIPLDFPRKNRDLEKGWRLRCGRARKVTDINRFVRFVRFVIQIRHSLPVSFLGCLDHEGPRFTMLHLGLAQVFAWFLTNIAVLGRIWHRSMIDRDGSTQQCCCSGGCICRLHMAAMSAQCRGFLVWNTWIVMQAHLARKQHLRTNAPSSCKICKTFQFMSKHPGIWMECFGHFFHIN